jgi:RNA polymerase sigma-32 factor
MMNTQLQTIPTLTPGGNVNAYIQTVSGFDILSLEREQALGQRLAYEDDLDAARELVTVCGSYCQVLQRLRLRSG